MVIIDMTRNFGFIHDKLEIKILILFVLQRIPEPIPFEALADLAMCDDGIGYFDYAECVADLVRTEHINHEDNKYSITQKGKHNATLTETNLPYSVRTKAEVLAGELRAKMSRDALIETSREPEGSGGYSVKLALSDGIGEIVSIKMFAVNEKQAIKLEKGFKKQAEKAFNALVDIFME